MIARVEEAATYAAVVPLSWHDELVPVYPSHGVPNTGRSKRQLSVKHLEILGVAYLV